jgi:hypothetical protein
MGRTEGSREGARFVAGRTTKTGGRVGQQSARAIREYREAQK